MPIARIIGAAVAVALLGVSLTSGLSCRVRNRELIEWQVARPMSADVDLSKPGELETPFRQTCGVSHGEVLLLDLVPPVALAENLSELFEGLDAEVTILDAHGKVEWNEPIKGGQLQDWGGKTRVVLTRFHPFPTGDYTARVSVHRGATELAGRRQTIYAQYQLCGLEGFPMLIAGAVSLVTFVPGFIALVVVTRGFAKHGWSVAPQAGETRSNSSDGTTA
jgi:hypothetical protein